mmetsp:Transcript_14546/g.28474  ORF Transcript_14546/g.28474 Transcript_14546/m.28474 type:complete len:213 (+) Transcript_14546:11835-12473(+)
MICCIPLIKSFDVWCRSHHRFVVPVKAALRSCGGARACGTAFPKISICFSRGKIANDSRNVDKVSIYNRQGKPKSANIASTPRICCLEDNAGRNCVNYWSPCKLVGAAHLLCRPCRLQGVQHQLVGFQSFEPGAVRNDTWLHCDFFLIIITCPDDKRALVTSIERAVVTRFSTIALLVVAGAATTAPIHSRRHSCKLSGIFWGKVRWTVAIG